MVEIDFYEFQDYAPLLNKFLVETLYKTVLMSFQKVIISRRERTLVSVQWEGLLPDVQCYAIFRCKNAFRTASNKKLGYRATGLHVSSIFSHSGEFLVGFT